MPPEPCCPYFHRAVELVGRRWTGAIVAVLLESPGDEPVRFSDIAQAIPDLSDRLLTERIKELERHGLIARIDGRYVLTPAGRQLEPAIAALRAWGRRWLAPVSG